MARNKLNDQVNASLNHLIQENQRRGLPLLLGSSAFPFIPNENMLLRRLQRIPAVEVNMPSESTTDAHGMIPDVNESAENEIFSEENIPSESNVDAAGMIPGHFQGEEGIKCS